LTGGALRGGVEHTDRFQRVAEEIEPERLGPAGGEQVENAAAQRTTGQRKSMALQAMSEVALTPETISRFRRSYIEAFGAPQR
ncbi:hypothetical protein ENZ67_30575, partial [Mesorhizobium sp. M7A.F.Ca.CA.002.03.1.1]